METLASRGFTRTLSAPQMRNVRQMLRLPAAATFSVPGAGKTTEALAYFLFRSEPDMRLLVVAPKNAFAAWEEQVYACIPNYAGRIQRLQGGEAGVADALKSSPDISLITYQQFYRVVPVVMQFLATHPCFMYLDESHRIKRGHDGAHGASVLAVAHLPVSKLIMSGTPLPNSLSDAVPQFQFLYPEIRVSEKTVRDQLQPVYVRTTKSELGLPPPRRIAHQVEMTENQRRLYEVLRSEAARHLEGLSVKDRRRMRAFGQSIVRLLQVTAEPALLLSTDLRDHELLLAAVADGHGPKVAEACRLARELARKGKKCIIWSQFVQVVEAIAMNLTDLGAEYIHGGVEADPDEDNTESREAKIKRFHDDPQCSVIVANPAACSEGISLHTVCHHAIYVDRNFNAAQYLQSEDRIHRFGLPPDQETYVVILHTDDSVDVAVQRRLDEKVRKMGAVLDDPDLQIEPVPYDEELGLSEGDLDELRSLLVE
jgi:SNF2 family DNA or RNA helicase